jgi:hypothetical protein
VFYFPPSDIWEMTMEELLFWYRGIVKVAKWRRNTR